MYKLMYTCDQCGKLTPNFMPYVVPINGKAGRSWCDDCEAEFDRERKWANGQTGEDITCPWCGYVDPNSRQMIAEYDRNHECKECGKHFTVTRYTEYTSWRELKDMPEGWDGND